MVVFVTQRLTTDVFDFVFALTRRGFGSNAAVFPMSACAAAAPTVRETGKSSARNDLNKNGYGYGYMYVKDK